MSVTFRVAPRAPRRCVAACPHLAGGEWGEALLLEYVFLEVVAVLRARRGKAVATEVAEQLLQAREVEFVPCAELFLGALATFRREAAPLSFADAAIATVARRDKHGYVATFDEDFRNLAGVTVIPA